jgi:A/G-specific adenine glycosylase
MLQQTQVDTVVSYYQRFVKDFPSVETLAKAPLEKVLKHWEGLGYYARARNLHRGAKTVVSDFNGSLPPALDELIRIPGIGKSTAGAILSLAFDKATPILDGNVKRVICRLFAVRGELERSDVVKRLWALSQKLTPREDAHDYTQAIMDLGAMICTPRSPGCSVCPLRQSCQACRLDLQDKLPQRRAKKKIPHYDMVLGVIRKRGRILIYQRPKEGLLGGLWDFPNYKMQSPGRFAAVLRHGVKKDFQTAIATGRKLGKISHAYTHFKISLHVVECICQDGAGAVDNTMPTKWVFPANFSRYAFPTAARKVFPLLHGNIKRG